MVHPSQYQETHPISTSQTTHCTTTLLPWRVGIHGLSWTVVSTITFTTDITWVLAGWSHRWEYSRVTACVQQHVAAQGDVFTSRATGSQLLDSLTVCRYLLPGGQVLSSGHPARKGVPTALRVRGYASCCSPSYCL